MEENKTPPSRQAPSPSWIDTLWDPSPPSPEQDPDRPTTSNIHIYTYHTNDDISSNYSKPFGWDQHGPPISEQYEDEDIMVNKHQEETYMEKRTLAYLGNLILSSHSKN